MNPSTDDTDTDPRTADGPDRTVARPATSTDGADENPGTPSPAATEPDATDTDPVDERTLPVEIGGQKGPEPTRYGDWEKKGRCTDF